MGLLPCPFPCTTEKESQSHSNSLRLSESSTSASSLSSQISLPSVPSLIPPSSQQHDHQISVVYHQCLATLGGHSSYVFSLTLAGNLLYSGSSNSEMRAWRRDPSNSVHPDSTDKIVATSIGAFKSLVIVGDRLFSAHQDCKIRVWKINNNNDDMHQKYNCIATLPTLNDRFLRFFSGKNYVQVRRHKKCTWVHHVDTVTALAISRDGSLLFSASWDRTFKAGKKKHSLVATMERHNSAVNALALSTDGLCCILELVIDLFLFGKKMQIIAAVVDIWWWQVRLEGTPRQFCAWQLCQIWYAVDQLIKQLGFGGEG
ncbi:hypothetical protein GH714_027221 [Hevea brasiliensis]|uniref:Uncharacterized protein n=1 Tax=Hevea brasiliensis TaxID=3981 RepID=A0A6A6NKG0_HEVBR|nr:hypothetical protein GH714_027221 [Hevea brasiliensis]